MPRWPAAVLFDFDGVIVNSEPLHFQAFAEVLAAEKIFISEEEYYREYIGFDDRGAIKKVFALHGRELDPKTFLRVMSGKSEMMMSLIESRKYRALNGVEEFVRGLWRQYPLGICSGALREEIEAMLLGVALRDCFSVIIAAEDVTIGKPDPQGYLLALGHLSAKVGKNLKPSDCLVIEDAPTVAKNVRDVGFKVLGLTTSYPAEKLSDCNWVVNSLRPAEVMAKVQDLKFEI